MSLQQLEQNSLTKWPFSKIRPKLKPKYGTLVISHYTYFLLAGSEKYRSITTGHYRYALGAILVYDVTNYESFKNCKFWIDSIREYADDNVVIALVGNKGDIPL